MLTLVAVILLALRHVHGLERALLHRVARLGAVKADLGRVRIGRRATIGRALLLRGVRVAAIVRARVVVALVPVRLWTWVVVVVLVLLLVV